MIERINQGLAQQQIRLQVADEVCDWLVRTKCQDRAFGARPLRRAIQRHIEDTLSESLIVGQLEKGVIEVYLDDERVAFRSAAPASST
jgi:ATP-dependent Clp protease ATP-binding subunit ClpC